MGEPWEAGPEIASFEPAAELVGLILQLDDLTADRMARTTDALGAVAEAQAQQAIVAAAQQAQAAAPEPNESGAFTLLVGVDATKVHAGGSWRDSKIAVVAPLGKSSCPVASTAIYAYPWAKPSETAGGCSRHFSPFPLFGSLNRSWHLPTLHVTERFGQLGTVLLHPPPDLGEITRGELTLQDLSVKGQRSVSPGLAEVDPR